MPSVEDNVATPETPSVELKLVVPFTWSVFEKLVLPVTPRLDPTFPAPEIFAVPSTSNKWEGTVVPIPTYVPVSYNEDVERRYVSLQREI